MVKKLLENRSGELFPFSPAMAKRHGIRTVILVPVPDVKWRVKEWHRCQQFLFDMLGEKSIPATTCQKAARKAGFSKSTIRQAKERSGIVSVWHGTIGRGRWWWKLKDNTDRAREMLRWNIGDVT